MEGRKGLKKPLTDEHFVIVATCCLVGFGKEKMSLRNVKK